MEQPLFPVPGSTAPAVLLGSGPGPAPALTEVSVPTYRAILDSLDSALGLRGWMLIVHGYNGGDVATAPKHHFSRAGARPPLIPARLTALQTLGFELVDPDERWSWQEATSLDGKRVELFAAVDVRELAHHREVAL
jgi:hypothetical protein